MKKFLLATAIFAISFAQAGFAQDAKPASPLPQLFSLYLDIKNALVSGDVTAAATKATEFLTVSKAIDIKVLSKDEHNAFMPLQDKLATDVKLIADSKNLEKQRSSFAYLSNNIYTLAKAVKLSETPVYQAYCPMKKMYWLSSETAIKNPFYGKSMLTCGKITDIIQ
jgi:hypothetical protein